MQDMKTTHDRLKGLFWGLVVGDSLGSPIQFTRKDAHQHITEMVPCETFSTPPGYWTDDSSMAFCVAESFVRLGGKYDLKDIAQNFVRWYDEGFWSSLSRAFDVGMATSFACCALKRKPDVLKNGDEESQGNGSIMRLAPSFIMNYGASDNQLIHEISDLTHCSQRVRETCDLMCKILNEHVNGQRTTEKSIYNTREEVNNSGWAVSTLQAALWAFETTTSFEDALIAAVNLGGDADSIGAVCGQIAGAYYGYEAIPQRWVQAVQGHDKTFEDVNTLIEQCINLRLEQLK